MKKTHGRNSYLILGLPVNWWLIGLCALFVVVFFEKIKSGLSRFFGVKNTVADIKIYNSGTYDQQTVRKLANEAWQAIWGGLGWFEDEARFTKAIKDCPAGQMEQLAIEYAKIESKGKNIYNDAVEFLRESQYTSIKHLL